MTKLRMSSSMTLVVAALLCLTFLSTLHALADTVFADKALQQGRADEAARLLQAVLSEQPRNAPAHQLLCRVYYAEEIPDAAVRECEQAVTIAPSLSDNQMWLGRAYGLKAETAGPFAGLSLARKVRLSFERAAQLDPANIPAATALGEFYIAAPPLIGGGLDKAALVADRLQHYSPAATHRLLAMIAEKRKDTALAEAEFKNAVAVNHGPEAWVDLGNFYQRQKQPDNVVAALQSALAADRAHDAALMDIASILTDAHRSPELAEKALRLYLASAAKSEAAPAFKVHVQLGKSLALRGDRDGARREYTAALALAAAYAPARKAMQRS